MTGSEGPEKENCEVDRLALVIVVLLRLLLVSVTTIGGLVVSTACVLKSTEPGVAVVIACAGTKHARTNATRIAAFEKMPLNLPPALKILAALFSRSSGTVKPNQIGPRIFFATNSGPPASRHLRRRGTLHLLACGDWKANRTEVNTRYREEVSGWDWWNRHDAKANAELTCGGMQ